MDSQVFSGGVEEVETVEDFSSKKKNQFSNI